MEKNEANQHKSERILLSEETGIIAIPNGKRPLQATTNRLSDVANNKLGTHNNDAQRFGIASVVGRCHFKKTYKENICILSEPVR